MPMTTFGDIGNRTAVHAVVTMLDYIRPHEIFSKMGQMVAIPKNKGTAAVFRRPVPFAPALVPLQEGVTPTPHRMKFEDVPVTVKQYGDLVQLTDVVADTAEDPVLKVMSELTAQQIIETKEQIIYNVLKGGTMVYYANGALRSSVNTPLTLNKQRAVTRQLEAMKAKKITRILSGSVNHDTSPIEAAFIAIAHTDLEADIRQMAGFVSTAEYGTRTTVSPHEIGSVESVRYILSPDVQPWRDAGGAPGASVLSTGGVQADVYPIIYLGADAYGVTSLRGSDAIVPVVLNPGSTSKSDPLGQRGFVGWKAWWATVILNQTWMCRLEVAASRLV